MSHTISNKTSTDVPTLLKSVKSSLSARLRCIDTSLIDKSDELKVLGSYPLRAITGHRGVELCIYRNLYSLLKRRGVGPENLRSGNASMKTIDRNGYQN